MNLWQSQQWQHFQEALKRKTLQLNCNSASALIIELPLILNKTYFLCLKGPESEKQEDLKILLEQIHHKAKERNTVFCKVYPKSNQNIDGKETWSKYPRTTLIINLKQSEQEILQHMKQKGRYNIKTAQKKGVVIKKTENKNSKSIKEFYNLLKQTTHRNQFHSQSISYYKTMLKTLPSAELYMAYHNNIPIAGAIFCFYKKTAIYYYGASSNQHRNFMAPYLLQWTAILEAKKKGCETYDFFGISPEKKDDKDRDKKDQWSGITRFKKQFGGTVITYPPAKDIVYNPLWYNIYRLYKYITGKIR
jgi:peptidoglycan pentaglycine glycine transferase (the first glycine)